MDFAKLRGKIPHKWRVQSFSQHRPLAICIPYVDSRDVAKHLDECLGPLNWQDDYKTLGDRTLCGIGVRGESGEWVWKWDTGSETKIEKEKGLISDSFKRAAVKWGVGRFLYEMGSKFVPSNEKKGSGNYPYVVDGTKKRVYDLTEYINNVLESKPSVEDKKVAAYWIDLVDHCTTYAQQIKWYNSNQGNIGKYLDDLETKKFLSYMTQKKTIFFEKEIVECPKNNDEKTLRKFCEECDAKKGCPAISI